MAGFLGLGKKPLGGLCLSAGLLLASCTRVVTGTATVDEVALTSYMSASSSSVASVSSSRAAAAQRAVCAQFPSGIAQIISTWHEFVAALTSSEGARSEQVDKLRGALKDASSQMKSASSEPDSALGKAVSAYLAAINDLDGIFGMGQISGDEINRRYDALLSTGRAVLGLCPS